MKSKTPLALMEQLAMVLVFAMAAALCLQVFALSGQLSRRNEARDRAVVKVQNAAETLKAAGEYAENAYAETALLLGGEASGDTLCVYYDADWNQTAEQSKASYRLYAGAAESAVNGLNKAEIWVSENGSDERLFTLTAAWQGEMRYG